MEDVAIGAIQRLAGVVGEVDRVDRVLRQVRAETKLRDDRALQVIP
jgi:hypothetical protein